MIRLYQRFQLDQIISLFRVFGLVFILGVFLIYIYSTRRQILDLHIWQTYVAAKRSFGV